ncbi:unnamed protein product [Rotaria socialis]|uniref:Uncharacterized protein n=1 Tax=Rotaria socialis TaxID=392032 RepID=A0A820MVF6_9BILA|nr:unnamed protein product [Rotaria socialis]CAF3699778.1 unnamed protein product [Rotaria socialis]CAF4378213.1 unnamed protein product [Rotaria socialis]CAF4542134.1 unnamed protein product [Rotaria socialis]
MLANPNCELELNFIPYNTLGQWYKSVRINKSQERIDDDGDSLQITEICQVNKTLDEINDSSQTMSPKPTASPLTIDEDSQESARERQTPTASSSKMHIMECDGNGNTSDVTLANLRLLVELFNLFYEYGLTVQQILIDLSDVIIPLHPVTTISYCYFMLSI